MHEFPTTHPRVIGLTGGIGSGKSTVCRAFQAYGVPVWSADAAGHAVYRNHAELRDWVGKRWGEELLVRDGKGRDVDVNRTALGRIVFGNALELAELSRRVHPLVARAFAAWLDRHAARLIPPPWVVREAAILFESGADRECDWVVSVEAPEGERLARVLGRDRTNAAAVRDRMATQWSDAQRRERSDWVLVNSADQPVLPQIDRFLHRLAVEEL